MTQSISQIECVFIFSSLICCFVAVPLLPSSHPTPSIMNLCVQINPEGLMTLIYKIPHQRNIGLTLKGLNNNGELYCWFCQRHNTGQFTQRPTQKSFWKMTFKYLPLKFYSHGKYWKAISFSFPLFLSAPKPFSSLLLAQSHTTHGPLTCHLKSHHRKSCGKCGLDPCSAFSRL